MIDIIPYGDNPYVIPTFHVVIIHRLFFCRVPTFLFII